RDDILGDTNANHPGAQARHVDVVVFHALPCHIGIVDHGAADPGHLVRRDGGSYAGPADEDPPIGVPTGHEVGHTTGHEGEVDRSVVRGADVDHLVAQLAHVVHHVGLQGEPRMVVPDGYPHLLLPSCSTPTRQRPTTVTGLLR